MADNQLEILVNGLNSLDFQDYSDLALILYRQETGSVNIPRDVVKSMEYHLEGLTRDQRETVLKYMERISTKMMRSRVNQRRYDGLAYFGAASYFSYKFLQGPTLVAGNPDVVSQIDPKSNSMRSQLQVIDGGKKQTTFLR